MCVVGKHCIIISRSGKYVNVGTFSPSAGSLSQVPIVDALVAYDCPRTNQTYLLVVRNALYVEDMEENLISLFILREAGLVVNECAKQHRPYGEATDDDHTIQCKEVSLKIPMKIRSTFSYFDTRKPHGDDIENCIPVVITPECEEWDPCNESFAEREDQLMNWKGDIEPPLSRHLEMIS